MSADGRTLTPSGGCLEVRLRTLGTVQADFAVRASITGRELLARAAELLDVPETWLLGLRFTDRRGRDGWLRPDERLGRAVGGRSPLEVTLQVRFWPPDAVVDALSEPAAQLVMLEVRRGVLSGAVLCPPAQALALAAFALQARSGDLQDARLERAYLSRGAHLPAPLEQQLLEAPAGCWQQRVIALHARLRGTPRPLAVRLYLRRARQLPMYGITYVPVTGRQGEPLWLGVAALGLHVYPCHDRELISEHDDKLTPLLRFPWARIRNAGQRGRRVTVQLEGRREVVFAARDKRAGRELLALIRGQLRAVVASLEALKAQKERDAGQEVCQTAPREADPGAAALTAAADDADVGEDGEEVGEADEEADQSGEGKSAQRDSHPAWESAVAALGWHVSQWSLAAHDGPNRQSQASADPTDGRYSRFTASSSDELSQSSSSCRCSDGRYSQFTAGFSDELSQGSSSCRCSDGRCSRFTAGSSDELSQGSSSCRCSDGRCSQFTAGSSDELSQGSSSCRSSDARLSQVTVESSAARLSLSSDGCSGCRLSQSLGLSLSRSSTESGDSRLSRSTGWPSGASLTGSSEWMLHI